MILMPTIFSDSVSGVVTQHNAVRDMRQVQRLQTVVSHFEQPMCRPAFLWQKLARLLLRRYPQRAPFPASVDQRPVPDALSGAQPVPARSILGLDLALWHRIDTAFTQDSVGCALCRSQDWCWRAFDDAVCRP